MEETFGIIPIEVLIQICKYLSISDIGRLMLVSKYLYGVIKHDTNLWNSLFKGRIVVHSCIVNSSKKTILSKFDHVRISNNWEQGIFKEKVLLHHKTNYIPWTHMSEKCFMISVGSELFCYERNKKGLPKCDKPLWSINMRTLKRGTGLRMDDITRFVVRGANVVCGNRDGCVSVYRCKNSNNNDDKLTEKPELGHFIEDCRNSFEDEVSCVESIADKSKKMLTIFTGSRESNQLGSWIVRKKHRKKQFSSSKQTSVQNACGIVSMSACRSKGMLSIGVFGNSKPAFVDVETGTVVIHPSPSSVQRNAAVRDVLWYDNNILYYVTHSGLLQGVDLRTDCLTECYSTRDPFAAPIYCLKSDRVNAIVIGSSQYSRCVLYDRRMATHKQIYFTQKKSSPVYSLEFDKNNLITALDMKVAALDFTVNIQEGCRRDFSKALFR